MIRKHNKFNRPKKLFDITRIKEEDVLVLKYGLKNKREIWKAKAKLDNIRRLAKKLLSASQEEQNAFVEKLNKQGFKVANVVDTLSLTEENILKRRLQTVLVDKGIATTPRGARQLIVHKHVKIDGKVVNIPSYRVFISEENKISLKEKKKVHKMTEEKTLEVVA